MTQQPRNPYGSDPHRQAGSDPYRRSSEADPYRQGAYPGRQAEPSFGASSGRAPGWRIRSDGPSERGVHPGQPRSLRPPGRRTASRCRSARLQPFPFPGEPQPHGGRHRVQRLFPLYRSTPKASSQEPARHRRVAGDSGGHRRGRVLLPEPSLVRSHRERRQAHGRPGGDPGHHARGRHGFPAAGQPLGHRRHRRHRGRRRQVQRHRQRRSHQRREARSSRRATSSRSRTGQTRPRRSSPPRRKCPSRAWRTRTTGTGRCTSTFPA